MSSIRVDSKKVLEKWISQNADEILQIFWDIEHEGVEANYFALRESMKLEYEILKKNRVLTD